MSQNYNNWYSSVAQAYDKTRPGYPQQMINRVVELAQLPQEANILEIGCGPGTATVAFANLGYKMLCVEPSQELCQLAQKNCHRFPNVLFNNTYFEDWELPPQKFDAVLAATSIHWVPKEVAYSKAAQALKNHGFIILLWNASFQNNLEVYQVLDEVYQQYAPSLVWYEQKATHQENLKKLGDGAIASGLFQDLVFEELVFELAYSSEDYLMLLSTFSPYIKLDYATRDALFVELKTKIDKELGGTIKLSWLSVLQLFAKIRH